MRREGRLHGYEFDRYGESQRHRVKTCRQPTNRSKFRPKPTQYMAARPRSKALKKMKGQRNKAHSSDVVSNYQMHEWALPRHLLRSTVALAASTTSISSSVNDDNGARDMEPVCLAFLLGNYTDSSQHPGDGHPCRDSPTVQEIVEEDEDLDSSSDDWLDLASIDCYSDAGADDEWYLC